MQHGSSQTPTASDHQRPAKIAYIMSRFPKLTETFILYEILALESFAVPVEIYPLLRAHQRVAHPEAQRLVKQAHFHPFLSLPILYAQWYFIRQCPHTYFKLWAEVLRETWGSVNFFVGALGIFPKAVRFAYEMMQQGITHVHAHFANHPAVAGLIIHRLTGIPFSFTAHGSDLHVERRMLDKKVAAAAFAVTISDYNKELMVQECGDEAREKIRVIHCGVDPEVFSPHTHHNSTGPFQILCVGSLEEVKGHTYLIEACRLLRERGVEFVCHLVGDGPLCRQIATQIRRTGLQQQVCMHGGLPRHEVVKLHASADVLVLASVPTQRGKREGIPVVLMEGMASGLPVVSSAISGIPELVESGQTGLLVPPRDAIALAEALYRLWNDAALRGRLGRAGREKVLQEFNLPANAAELSQLFLQESPVMQADS
jgi:colanic acid/amylovoran biosynthesis glycosyltransferase